jgi:polyhydroxyalkanoate synthesis repressor PhaR
MTEKSGKSAGGSDSPPITIKKYANRRLYNTATSSYVTLDHLAEMVRDGQDFTVTDAKTGEDITRSVLTQIIVEEESRGQNLLPISVLRQLIGLYGDNMQMLVPQYLEYSMKAFAENQDKMRQVMQQSFGGMFPIGGMDAMAKQNMAMFENAMRMFNPFAHSAKPSDPPPAAKSAATGLEEMKAQLDLLREQIETLSKLKGG